MAEIMGTVTSVKRYLSPEKIELKISPDLGGESTIILQQNRKYIIPDFQREIRWEENNLSILLSDLSTSPRFLGNIILTIKKDGDMPNNRRPATYHSPPIDSCIHQKSI